MVIEPILCCVKLAHLFIIYTESFRLFTVYKSHVTSHSIAVCQLGCTDA